MQVPADAGFTLSCGLLRKQHHSSYIVQFDDILGCEIVWSRKEKKVLKNYCSFTSDHPSPPHMVFAAQRA